MVHSLAAPVNPRAADCLRPANVHCPRTIDTWYIPGKSPIRVSQLHCVVAVDLVTGRPACPPFAVATRFEAFEFWSSDIR